MNYLVLISGAAGGYVAGFLLMRAPAPAGHRSPIAAAVRLAAVSESSWGESLATARATPAASREETLLLWADGIALADIPRAVAQLDPRREFQALKSLMYRWALSDGPAAMAAWRGMKLPSTFSRPDLGTEGGRLSRWSTYRSNLSAELGAAILGGWAATDVEAARKYVAANLKTITASSYLSIEIEKLTGRDATGQESMAAFEKRVQADPEAAAGEAIKRSTPAKQAQEVRKTLAAWLKTDPSAAARWFESLPANVKYYGPMVNMEWPLSSAPPADKLPLMAGMLAAQGSLKQGLEQAAANGLHGDGDSLMDFEGTGRTLRNAAVTAVEWAVKDQAAAQRWLETVASPDLRGFLTGHVAGDLAQRGQVAQAIEAVNALPAESQAQAFPGLAQRWAESDAAAALTWSQKIPDTEARDLFLTHLLRATADADPGWALEQLPQLSSAAADTLKRDILKRWAGQNPEAAGAWKQGHGG